MQNIWMLGSRILIVNKQSVMNELLTDNRKHHRLNTPLLFKLQKRSIRLITFSKFDDHSSPLFKQTRILKSFVVKSVFMLIYLFMFKFYNKLFPSVFDNNFVSTSTVPNYNMRLFLHELIYSIQRARTNLG